MLLVLLTFVGISVILLNTSYFQQRLVEIVIKDLSKQTNSRISIKSSELSLFRGLVFYDVQLSDSLNRPFLKTHRLDARVRLLPLFSRRVEISQLRFIEADVSLFRETPESELNIQPFLDSFKSTKKTVVPWHIDLSSLILHHCHIRYDILSKPAGTGRFDMNHLEFSDLSTKISLKIAPKNHYQFQINKFQAFERSGLRINQLRLQAKLSEKGLILKDFKLELPNSTLEISSINAKYKDLSAFSSFADSVFFNPTDIRLSLRPSDLTCFSSSLAGLTKNMDISIEVGGKLSDLTCKKLHLNMEDLLFIDGSIRSKGFPGSQNFYSKGLIETLEIHPECLEYFSGILSHSSVKLPFLHNLGVLKYMGQINAIDHNLILTGDFATVAGNVGVNIQLSQDKINKDLLYDGKLSTKSFQLNTLFPENNGFKDIALDISVNGKQNSINGFSGMVDGLISHIYYHGYDYHNLTLNGQFSKKEYKGKAVLKDKNAMLNFVGFVNLSKKSPEFKFDLAVDNLNLHTLKLISDGADGSVNLRESNLSFMLHSNFTGNNMNEIQGQLSIDSLAIFNNKEWFRSSHILLESFKDPLNKHLRISSSILNGEIWGKYDFSNLATGFKQIVKSYCPSLFKTRNAAITGSNDFNFTCAIVPSPQLEKVFGLPFTFEKELTINGFYSDPTGRFRLKADIPKITYGKTTLQSAGLLFENPQKEAKIIAYAQLGTGEKQVELNFDARTVNDNTNLNFQISNSAVKTYSGTILGNIRYSRDEDKKLKIDAFLNPSNLIVGDSIWQIHPTNLNWKNNRLFIQDFQLTHANQFIKIQGSASGESSDTLSISLNSFSIDDLFQLLPSTPTSVVLGGLVSGNADCVRLFKDPAMEADLVVNGFSLNHAILGTLTAKSKWNNTLKALALDGVIRSESKNEVVHRKVAIASGAYYPSIDSMNLSIDADSVPLDFLNPWLGKILDKLSGSVYGTVHLMGPMKKLGVYANAYVKDVSFGVRVLNTRYSFSDSILVSPQIISFQDAQIHDRDGNIAYATGILRHNYFKNIQTAINIQTKKDILVMDIPPSPNVNFYGIAYGSGSVSINGPGKAIVIDVNLRSGERTKGTISLLNKSQVEESSFMNFTQKNNDNEYLYDLYIPKKSQIKTDKSSPSNLTVNLQIEASPNAELTLITDPISGDEIKARGTGAIHTVIKQSESTKLFGNFTIETGNYKFIYKNLFRRDFSIENGSNITFSGDPFDAELNINANYTVNAKLSDLLSSDDLNALKMNSNSIPVNCVLQLTGKLKKPDIKLGLAYPSADEELQRRVMNVINTDEMMNQQIVFLMLFGRFNTPSYSTTQSSSSNVSTVLNTTISTLSSQFNTMIGNAFGKSNLAFDFDYRNATYETGTPGEWNVGMSGQWLNNRLTFNGNVGSRENLTQGKPNEFIGEFELDLKMKNSQKWSWKFFNRANDDQQFKSALNTQGLGIIYKENFSNFSDLFRQMANELQKPFQKSERKEKE